MFLRRLNRCYSKFEVASSCSRGDITKNTHRSTTPKFSREYDEMHYIRCKQMHIYWSTEALPTRSVSLAGQTRYEQREGLVTSLYQRL